MNNLHVLTVGAEKEEVLQDVGRFLKERDIPIRFDGGKHLHQVLERLSEKSFDAIVCVVERPDELAIVVRLRKAAPADTPILLLTDSLESDIARWGRALGATEILERRTSQERFVETLRQTLETRRLTREQRLQVGRTLHHAKDIAALAREAHRQAQRARTLLGKASPFAGLDFILVEDDADHAFLMLRAFAKSHLPGPSEVLKDGAEAIAYLSGEREYSDRRLHPLPSLIILDLHLPKKSGFEVLEWIRRDPRLEKLSVVILSCSSAAEDIDRARALGANLYLVKPVGLDALLETARAIAGYWVLSTPGAVPH